MRGWWKAFKLEPGVVVCCTESGVFEVVVEVADCIEQPVARRLTCVQVGTRLFPPTCSSGPQGHQQELQVLEDQKEISQSVHCRTKIECLSRLRTTVCLEAVENPVDELVEPMGVETVEVVELVEMEFDDGGGGSDTMIIEPGVFSFFFLCLGFLFFGGWFSIPNLGLLGGGVMDLVSSSSKSFSISSSVPIATTSDGYFSKPFTLQDDPATMLPAIFVADNTHTLFSSGHLTRQ